MVTGRVVVLFITIVVLACGCSETPVEPEWGVPPAEVPAGALRIPVRVTRYLPGDGMVTVSNAIPLPPGVLQRDDLRKFRLIVDGKEPHLYVEALEGEHPDGSLRSVLVQFRVPTADTAPLDGELILHAERAHVDRASLTNRRSLPDAVVLPTDPAYLVTTGIAGPTITVAESRDQGVPYSKYEADFATYGNRLWQLEGEDGCNNYYDRALIYFAFWARSGNPEYWRRGARCAVSYRTGYLEANNYGSSPHWSQLEGLEAHYILTGDDSSRYAIGEVERVLNFWYVYFNRIPETSSMEDRIRARTVLSTLLAWRVNARSGRDYYAAKLDTSIARIAASQGSDGSYRFPSLCDQSMSYMTGQLNDALIKTYLYYRRDPAIPAIVQRSADFLWNTQWLPEHQVFQYMSGNCDQKGDTMPGLDLNGLIVNTFSFVYKQTGNITYRDRADQVFAGAVTRTSLTGSKQFNQQYYSTYLHLAFRK